MKTSVFSKLAVMCALVMVTLSFAACSEDDENGAVYYSMNIDKMQYSASSKDSLVMSMKQELDTIYAVYQTALSVSGTTFTYDNDSKVKQACSNAETTLSNLSFHGSYTFNVYNISSGSKVIYTYSIN